MITNTPCHFWGPTHPLPSLTLSSPNIVVAFEPTPLHRRFQRRYSRTSGEVLVSASFDNSAKVWSTRDWSLLRTLSGHEGKVRLIGTYTVERVCPVVLVSGRVFPCPVVLFRILSCFFASCRVVCRLLWFHVVSCLLSVTRYMFCFFMVCLTASSLLGLSFGVLSCPVSRIVLSCSVLSSPVTCCRALSRPVISCPVYWCLLSHAALSAYCGVVDRCLRAGDGVRRCSEREEDSHVLLRPNRQSLGPRKRVLAIVLDKRV